MHGLSLLMLMVITWAALTVVLAGLIIYRGVVGLHEENQIFLGRAEAAQEKQQVETLRRIKHLNLVIKGFVIVCGVLLLVIASIWFYQGIYRPQTPG
jgi:hypothetical protein